MLLDSQKRKIVSIKLLITFYYSVTIVVDSTRLNNSL